VKRDNFEVLGFEKHVLIVLAMLIGSTVADYFTDGQPSHSIKGLMVYLQYNDFGRGVKYFMNHIFQWGGWGLGYIIIKNLTASEFKSIPLQEKFSAWWDATASISFVYIIAVISFSG
jgi:hypothetical protein